MNEVDPNIEVDGGFPIEPDPMDDVDSEILQDIDQLIAQGCLSAGFSFGGHTFVIKTLNSAEANAVAAAIVRFQGTLREVASYMQATVGLSLVMFDNDAHFHIKTDDLVTHAAKRFQYIGEWDDVIVEHVFGEYMKLDQRRIRARKELGNLSQPNRANFSPSPDSLTEQGIFSDGTPTAPPF